MADSPLRILIVDDETPARRRLRELLDDCAAALPIVVVGEAANGQEAMNLLHTVSADLVLSDIRMPDMDGIELARHLLKLPQPPVVIFTTAYHEHALQAFEVNAVDYLVKPVRMQRLLAALHKVPRLKPIPATKLDQLPASARRFLSVTERSRVVLVPDRGHRLSQGRAQVHHHPDRAARAPARGIADAAGGRVRHALRAGASQLSRRARVHPWLRAPGDRRRGCALGSVAEGRCRNPAGVASPAVGGARDRPRDRLRRLNRASCASRRPW